MNPRYRRLLIPGLLTALVVVVVVAALTDSSEAAVASEATEVSRFLDPDITESSGLAVSPLDPDLVHTVNDSGSAPVVFTVRLSTGETVGRTTLDGVAWRDPEALAVGPDGTLWVADTGDNLAARDDTALYVLPEPAGGDDRVTPTVFPVSFAGGPRDVEALLVDPTGGPVHLVTKGLLGGEVFRLPADLTPGATHRAEPVGVAMPGLVTDAAFHPDGERLVVRTYGSALLYDRDFVRLGAVELPFQEQGETIAVEATGTYLVGSEGTGSALTRVPAIAPEADDARSGDAPRVGAADGATVDAPEDTDGVDPSVVIGVLAALGVILVGLLVVRGRRRP
ncbi:hypothetical protein HMPREF0063_11746 [Aeromicrobium marinum DSM 15272]|uniref:WD40 repeat domain-containing protein n=1 Tax=Aeromicrobium marinum DSM 15272 TaxID=585531 RepID=E2SDG0_9ACTN|nr:hypothetical protein [Aeromicrobium marinum]EFQ82537.1 hypothetical protein HMPREF0063_11746 [Aeromicrobium marinum DSM 15272]